MRPYNPNKPLAFMHIPKCAGASLKFGLQKALMPTRFVSGFDRTLFGLFEDFDSMDIELRSSIYKCGRDLPRDADYIGGHFSASTLFEAFPTAQYMTVLREPKSRLLSNWLYWRSTDDLSLSKA